MATSPIPSEVPGQTSVGEGQTYASADAPSTTGSSLSARDGLDTRSLNSIYQQFMWNESLPCTIPEGQAMSAEVELMLANVCIAHTSVQEAISRYMNAKKCMRVMEQCRVELESKSNQMSSLIQQIEGLCEREGEGTTEISACLSEVLSGLDTKIESQRDTVRVAENDLRCLSPVVNMLGNPNDHRGVVYHGEYLL
jgi:predicted metal-dependent hydrolase